MKIIFIISMLVLIGACQGEDYLVQSAELGDEYEAGETFYIYGACDARVVSDRDKGIDISSEDKFFRPAVFKIRIEAGVPAEVEMLMLASHDEDDELLYQGRSSLLRMEVAPQSDILLKDGERTINRYRGNSPEQQGSIDINWYTEADLNLTTDEGAERVVHVDFASDPYNNDKGVRRWGQHYVCHRNVGINALDSHSYSAHID